MKQFVSKRGGQRIYTAQDLVRVQDEILSGISGQFSHLGNFIFSGCEITGGSGAYAITEGYVFLAGKLRKFNAVSDIVSLPKYIVPEMVEEVTRVFKLGNSETVFHNYTAVLSDTALGADYIELNINNKNTYLDVIQNSNKRFVSDELIQQLKLGEQDGLDITGNHIYSGTFSFVKKYNVVNFSIAFSMTESQLDNLQYGDTIGFISEGMPTKVGSETYVKLRSSANGSEALLEVEIQLNVRRITFIKKEVISNPNSGFRHAFNTSGSYLI